MIATDTLDILDFPNMDAPVFTTNVNNTLVLTPAASFTGVVEAWTTADAIDRRNIFLAVGNCHLAEVQVQRLHPEGRQHVLDHLPDVLPVHDPVQYTRTITAAIREVPPEARPEPTGIKATHEQLEAYRRCLLVRAAAYGGNFNDVLVVALSMGVIDSRTPRKPKPS